MGDNFIADTERSDWRNEIRSAIRRHEVRGISYDVLVMKLRPCYRVPLEQYTPKQWLFGLHNRDALHSRQSEDLKVALAAACELGPWVALEPWEAFCASVVDNPGDVLKAYGLNHGGPKFSKKEVQCLLTLDALTIFFVFAEHAYHDPPVREMKNGYQFIRSRMFWGYAHVLYDLFLCENQITLALLQNVVRICYEKWRIGDSTGIFRTMVRANVVKMCEYIFEQPRGQTGDLEANFDVAYPQGQGQLEQCAHIVACVHRTICGAHWNRKSQGTMRIIQPATSLKKAGIQIKGVVGLLDKVVFSEGCLSLPIINLFDQTESYFRNLAMYEFMTNYNSLFCPFGEYLQLMTSLIKEVGDVKLLIDCGVIKNTLGNDNTAFQMWNSLQSDLFLPKYSAQYNNMVARINDQCKSTLRVLRTEFVQLFCSRPWHVFGLITATIVTLATCIQAYTAVIGSDKMKPHFPPSPKP